MFDISGNIFGVTTQGGGWGLLQGCILPTRPHPSRGQAHQATETTHATNSVGTLNNKKLVKRIK